MPTDFLTGAPFRGMDSETLAKLAQANFRPPGLINAPGMPAMSGLAGSPPPGFNVRELTDGATKLFAGLSALNAGGQSNGMSILSPSDTMAAYNALPTSITRPGMEDLSLPVNGNAAAPAGIVSMSDFLTGDLWQPKLGLQGGWGVTA